MRRISFIVALLALASVGSGSAQTELTIRVVGPSNDGIKAVYYGLSSGIFRKYGLNVQISPVANGGAASTALTGGAADVAFVGIATPIFAHNHGVPMQIIAPVSLYRSEHPHNAAVVLKDSPIHSGRDMTGLTFGTVTIGDQLTASMLAWIDRTGGDSKRVKIVEIPPATAEQALENGVVAAVIVNEPFVSQLLSGGKTRVLTHPQDLIAKTFESGAYAVMAPAVAANPEAFRRFAEALHESSEYTNSHLPETVDLVAGYTHLAPEVVARSVRIVDGDYVEAKNIQPVIDILVKYGMTDKAFPAQELVSSAAVKSR